MIVVAFSRLIRILTMSQNWIENFFQNGDRVSLEEMSINGIVVHWQLTVLSTGHAEPIKSFPSTDWENF